MRLLTHVFAQIDFGKRSSPNKDGNSAPRATAHMWRSACFGLRVSVSTSTFSRQDSNRCTLDLVTESLFYPLLTDFISFPSLPCLCSSRPVELFKSSFFLFKGAGGLFCVACRASAVQHVFTASSCSLDKHVAARN